MAQYQNNYRNRPQPPKNITHTRLTRIWGRNAEGTAASFNVYMTNNAIRLTVYTGTTEDKRKERDRDIGIVFKEDKAISFITILDCLRDMALNQDNGQDLKQHFPNYIKPKGKDRFIASTISIGRDKNGVYWITATTQNHSKVKFNLLPHYDTEIYNVNTGEPATDGYKSKMFMLAWTDFLKQVLANVMVSEYRDEEAGDQGGNQSNNQQKSTPQNTQAKADNFEDDLDDFLNI